MGNKKRNTNEEGGSGGRKGGHSRNHQSGGVATGDSAFWTSLEMEDEAALEQLLFLPLRGTEDVVASPRQRSSSASSLLQQRNSKGASPLSYAVSKGFSESLLRLLLQAGAPVNQKEVNREESTALHLACWNEDMASTIALLDYGADPRRTDGEGRTPLHILAGSNASDLFFLILDSTAAGKSLDSKARPGEIGEEGDEENGDHPAVPLAKRVIVDPLTLLTIKDAAQGATVVHVAAGEASYGYRLFQDLLNYLETMQQCGDTGRRAAVASVVTSAMASTGETALHILLGMQNTETALVQSLVQRLLVLGADPFARTKEGMTPLDVAVVRRVGHHSKEGEELYTTLLHAMQPIPPVVPDDATAMAERIYRSYKEDGMALIHTAILSHNAAAVKAMCTHVTAALATTPAVAMELLSLPTKTPDVITTVELLASTADVETELAERLIVAGAVEREAYVELRESCIEVQRSNKNKTAEAAVDGRRRKNTSTSEGNDFQEELEEEGDSGAAQQTPASEVKTEGPSLRNGRRGPPLSRPAGGASRLQQARKARAMASHSTSQRHHERESVEEKGGIFSSHVSAPVKIFAALLLCSLFVSLYTMSTISEGNHP